MIIINASIWITWKENQAFTCIFYITVDLRVYVIGSPLKIMPKTWHGHHHEIKLFQVYLNIFTRNILGNWTYQKRDASLTTSPWWWDWCVRWTSGRAVGSVSLTLGAAESPAQLLKLSSSLSQYISQSGLKTVKQCTIPKLPWFTGATCTLAQQI